MGAGEERASNLPSKISPAQETSKGSYPDWSTSVTPPTPPAYMWRCQQLVTPYGAPLPYPTLYSHGSFYAHPNMPVGAALTNADIEGKSASGKDLLSTRMYKGTSRHTVLEVEKSGERGNTASGSGNDGVSQSAESASEGSPERNEENLDQQASSASKNRSFNQILADGKSSIPTANLNIGMDLWNASPAEPVAIKLKTNASGASQEVSVIAARHESLSHNNQLTQDEREQQRERRKQSNRESAKRSRLRKQAECEELQARVQKLNTDNQTLRDELTQIAEECEKINSENNSIMEELTNLYGPDVTSKLEGIYNQAAFHSVDGEHNRHGQETSVESDSITMSGQNGQHFNSNSKHDS